MGDGGISPHKATNRVFSASELGGGGSSFRFISNGPVWHVLASSRCGLQVVVVVVVGCSQGNEASLLHAHVESLR